MMQLFFLFFPRIALFSVTILHDERVVVIAEQRPGCKDEDVRSELQSSTFVSNV